MRSRRRLAR